MGFVLYRSSAGSGKTFTLVKEYLKLVLGDPGKFKHILAVTFTNKAAGEMKERILKALKNLSKGEDKDLELLLKQENPRLHDIPRVSSDILTQLLHHYSDFAIMTIDSFIHRVIKAFALEIGLPLNFTIDLNYEKIQDHVIERLLADVGKDDFITSIILEFVLLKVQQEKSWNIEPEVKQFEADLFNEKNIDWITEVSKFDNIDFFRWVEQLETLRNAFIQKFNDLGRRGLDLIRAAGLTIDDFAYKKTGAAGFLEKCLRLRPGGEKDFEMGVRFREGQWIAKSTPGNTAAAIEGVLANGLEQIHSGLIEHYDSQRSRALTASAILDNIYLAAIINRVKRLIEEYKKENNVVPISEFNMKVYEIVKASPVPFIYSLLGEKYSNYLIDEFQDTSRLQWENLFPLIDNALGSGFFSMAVGDGKQSIYRWRGGDVEIMENDINRRINPEHLTVNVLGTNYRSRELVVDFNNAFFAAVKDHYREQPLLDGIYSDITQNTRPNKGGFVSLEIIEETNTAEEADPLVFARIKRMIDDCLGHGFELNDIAILVRENKKGRVIAESLLENRIPVVSPDSLSLAKVPLIRFLIDVLTYLTNPGDKIAEAAIIYFLGLNHRLKPMSPDTIGNFFMENKAQDISTEFTEFFKLKHYLIRLPVYEAIEEVIRIFNLDRPGEGLDFETGGYLQAFLDVVSGYTAENSVDLSSFLDWWEFNRDTFTLEVPENKPAIRIMSIHKAKGLEFPVVIVPYAEWEHRPDKQIWLIPDPVLPTEPPINTPMPVNTGKALEETYFQAGYKKEKEKVLIDNINLLYVAFTRAIDSLFIIVQRKSKSENFELLNDLAVPLMKADEASEGKFSYGVPTRKEKKPLDKASDIEFRETRQLISNQWYPKITIRRKAKEFWRFDEGYREERRSWGLLIHQVLSHIRTAADVPSALEKTLASGEITAGEKAALEEKIREILQVPEVNRWFNPPPGHRVFIEAPLLTSEGMLRPDRVIIGDSVTVIDFKTGAKQDSHRDQMRQYKNAIHTMGYTETGIQAYLFYLESKQVEPAT